MRKALKTLFVVALLAVTTAVMSGAAFAGGHTANDPSGSGSASGKHSGAKNVTNPGMCKDPWFC